MANVKITDLTAISASDLATSDVIPIVDINNDQTKKVQLDELRAFVAGANDFVTFTRLQANIDLVQDNVATVSVGTASDTETRLNANLNVLDANADAIEARRVANVTIQTAIEARRVANVTIMTNEDTALQSRLTTNVTALTNEDTALQARLTTNATAFTNEDTALQSRLTTNVTALTNEDTALQARLTTNATAFTNEDTALQARIAANTLVAASNDFVTFTRLDANIDVVSANAAAVETRRTQNIAGAISSVLTGNLTASRALSSDSSGKIAVATTTLAELNHVSGVSSAIQTQLDAIEARRAANNITTTFTDDVVVTGNLTVNGATTTVSTTNLDVEDRMIMLADGVTGSPSADVGLLFNRGNQGNAAFFYDESAQSFKLSDTKDPKSNTSLSPVSASNLDVGALSAASVSLGGSDLSANLTALAAGVVTAGTSGVDNPFPSGDDLNFGTLTGANTTIDAFGVLVGSTTFFDCKEDPKGRIATEDLGALS